MSEKVERQNTTSREKKKRENIVNESEDFENFEKVVVEKSEETKNAILQVLQRCYVFESLEASTIEDIIDVMVPADCPTDQDIILQNEKGDKFYVILDGQAQVIVNGDTVYTYEKPSFFGELSLMYNAPRAATIHSITPCNLFTLDLRSFRYLLTKTAEDGLMAKCSFLKKVPIFKDFPDMMISQVATAMTQKGFEKGAYIITEGESGEEFYILKDGAVKCTSEEGGDLCRLTRSGDYFGEMALMLDEPRQANCIADSEEVVCYVISRDDFDATIGKLRDVQVQLTQTMRARILSSVPILSLLTEEELTQVSNAMKVLHVSSGKCVYKEGDEATRFFIINSGSVILTKLGETEPIKTIETNDFFGEASLLANIARENTVTALEDLELLVLSREVFQSFVVPSAGHTFPQELESRKTMKPVPLDTTEEEIAKVQYGMDDLVVGKTIGAGTFGRVKVVTITQTDEVVAMKCMYKSQIIRDRQEKNIIHEKNILGECRSPFIINQLSTFQSNDELYILMEMVQGGELWTYIYEKDYLFEKTQFNGYSNSTAQFYAGCVTKGLSHLSDIGVAYRDLKPENLLMDNMGYIKIIDFGFAKHIPFQKRGKEHSKTFTLCGTPEYLAPELVLSKGHDKSADHWALGCLVYELLIGKTPFQHDNQQEIFKRIIKSDRYLTFPDGFDGNAQSIITNLLNKEPSQRLGNMSEKFDGITGHAWFHDFDWDALGNKTMAAPHVPSIQGTHDMSCFEDYPEEDDPPPFQGDQEIFKDF